MYDLIIIGAGPAGLSASVYASRYKINHLVIGELLGGQISETHKIDNYLAVEDANGFEFSQKMEKHVKKYGTEIMPTKASQVKKTARGFVVTAGDDKGIEAKTVLLAMGTKKRKVGITGEEEFLGKGVSYCATCDGFFYRNKTVAVIGGSDSAVGAAVYLGDLAERVYLIYRKNQLRAEPFWVEQVKNNTKIKTVFNTNVLEIKGGEKIEKVVLDHEFEGKKEIELDGLFIEAGSIPFWGCAQDLKLEADEENYLKVSSDGKTSEEGIWAAGDITTNSDKFRQVITAASEGAICARSIYQYLQIKK